MSFAALQLPVFAILAPWVHFGLVRLFGRRAQVQSAIMNEQPRKSSNQNKQPKAEQENCSACRSLRNTVKTIDKHIIICSEGPWPKHAEKVPNSFIKEFSSVVEQLVESGQCSLKVKVTVCDRASPKADYADVIVYPEKVMYRVPKSADNAVAFAQSLLCSSSASPKFHFEPIPLQWDALVLICKHAARDKRCGTEGPILINAFRDYLSSGGISGDRIAVFGSSHIGGHEFAGTLIVYPEGLCYGYVTKDVVPTIVGGILKKDLSARSDNLEKCFRGKYNPSW
jgi:hypothetical protein